MEEAKEIYRRVYTGILTDPHDFGNDPLSMSEQLYMQREHKLRRNYNFIDIFHEIVNNNRVTFKNAILFCIHITNNLR